MNALFLREDGRVNSAVDDLDQDAGMSLVELIVAMAVSALLLGVIAAIFGQGLAAQAQQASRNTATAQLDAVSAYLNESIRNSTTARVSESGSRLDLTVVNEAGTAYECRAWKISGETLWYSSGTTAPAFTTTWAKLAQQLVDPASGAGSVGFINSGSAVSYLLNVKPGDIEVTIRDGGYPGAKSNLGGTTC